MKEKILNHLQYYPGVLPCALAMFFNLNPSSVRKALTILRRQNKVVRAEDGTYSLLTPPAPAQPETVNP